MTNQSSKPNMSAFFDRLITQLSPHASSPEMYSRQAQVVCGRWLALRRLMLGITLENLADATNLTPENILFVETGLADEMVGTTIAWRGYSRALADQSIAPSLIHNVLLIALGHVITPNERILMRVLSDLKRVDEVPRGAKGQQHEAPAAVSPWMLILRWIDKSVAAIRTSVVGPITLAVRDPDRATVLALPEIDMRSIHNAAMQRDTATPSNVRLRSHGTIVEGVMHYLATGNSPSLHPISAPKTGSPSPVPRSAVDDTLQAYLRILRDAIYSWPTTASYTSERLRGLAEQQRLTDSYVELTTDGVPRVLRQYEQSAAHDRGATAHASEQAQQLPAHMHKSGATSRRRLRHTVSSNLGRHLDPVTLTLTRAELVEEAVAQTSRLVLLGESGSGKSASLRYLTQRLSESCLDTTAALPTGWNTPKIPILCSLEAFADTWTMQTPRDEQEIIQCLLRSQTALIETPSDIDGQHLWHALLQGEALLLLDGLDEVPDVADIDGHSPRAQIISAIQKLGRRLPPMTQIVVTCRTQSYRHLSRHRRFDERLGVADGWQTRTLRPLASEQMRVMIRRQLYAAQEPAPALASAQYDGGKAGALAARIADDHALTRLYTSPLSLSLLLTLLGDEAASDPPHDRVHLYDRFVTLTLRQASTSSPYHYPGPLSPVRLANDEWSREVVRRSGLQAVAFAALQSPKSRESAPHAHAATLHDLRQTFPHAAIQEFLAACHLAGLPDVERRAAELWYNNDGGRWRDVLLLMAGRLHQLGLVEDALIPWLLQLAAGSSAMGEPKSGRQRQRDVLLAADSYAELGRRKGFDRHLSAAITQFEEALAEALLVVLVHQPLATTDERLSAGAHLAAIGDPRHGVMTIEPEWCTVGAGPFSTGGADESGVALPRQISVTATFQIGRFLVTNMQWRSFMDDGGYANPAWWINGRSEPHWTQPRFWEVPGFDAPNQPVVGISWLEATAFCLWLTARGHADGWLCDDEQVRLPTAVEWERAARGLDGREYPWGNRWDVDCANTQENDMHSPTPVGCYPNGESPYGVHDMAGNVAEWCITEAEQPPLRAAMLRSVRRGGSWAESHLEARCAVYRETEPETRGNLLGMRVVRIREEAT